MGKKLYVGNLSYSTTEEDLRVLFSEVGTPTSVSIITDRYSGQSKGFGFVEMESDQAAQDAIQRFNDYEVSGRNLKVSEARPQTERSGGYGGGGGGNRGGGGGSRRGGPSRGGSGGGNRRY